MFIRSGFTDDQINHGDVSYTIPRRSDQGYLLILERFNKSHPDFKLWVTPERLWADIHDL